jgi:uncharacterized protein (TIGR03435 family)
MLLPALLILATAASAHPAFEVASVRQNTSGDRWESLSPITGGRFTARNVTVAWLLKTAYHVEPFQISGLPSWTNSERYDVTARAADPAATADQIRAMLQSLLADRFQLVLHRETRDLPSYALVVARNGPKLTKAKSDTCPPAASQTEPCGGFRIYKRSQMWGNTVTLRQFAAELTFMMERTVVDKTGIEGLYDLRVEWTPEHFGPEPGDTARPDEPNPTLFTAVQEQLGLKLQSEKAPVEILAVERVSRPAEN